MKVLSVFACIVVLCVAAPKSTTLQQDFLDFMELIPIEDLQKIVEKHLKNDVEFQAAVQYFQSSDWEELEKPIEESEEAKELYKYLINAGLDLEIVFAFLEEFLSEAKIKTHHNHPSLRKFLDDVNAVIPHEELMNLLSDKMENSPHFQDFYDRISSERFHKIVEKLLAMPEMKTLINKLVEMDIPIPSCIQTLYTFFGWPTTSIKEEYIRK